MAPLTDDDKILIKILHLEKGYSAVHMTCAFPARNWSRRMLCNLNKCINKNGQHW